MATQGRRGLFFSWPQMTAFLEAFWHGQGIGDGGDLDEALQSYQSVEPDDGDWTRACTAPGADPWIERFASFEAYLDNEDALERIPVTAQMIINALPEPAASEQSSSEQSS